MTFLERALGFEPGVVLLDPDGQPRYAEMQRDGTVVMLTRRGDATAPGGGAAALYTYVEDVDRALAGARQAGAGVSDPEGTAWGDRGYGYLPYDYVLKRLAVDWWVLIKAEWLDQDPFKQ